MSEKLIKQLAELGVIVPPNFKNVDALKQMLALVAPEPKKQKPRADNVRNDEEEHKEDNKVVQPGT